MIALFAALSGAAFAAQEQFTGKVIKDNSIKSVDLKDGKAVTGTDVVDESLEGVDVAPDSLLAEDLATDSVGANELAPNAAGPSEIADNAVNSPEITDNAVGTSEIAPNSVGTAEITNGQVRSPDLGPLVHRSDSFSVAAGTSAGGFVSCQSGETRISGGAIAPGINGSFLQSSFPNGANGWSAIVRNNTAADFNAVVYSLCLQS